MLPYFLQDQLDAAVGWILRPGARMLLAALMAFLVVVASGGWFIRMLRGKCFIDPVEKGDSDELDALHAHKKSTPTMGGVLVIGGVLLATLVWARIDTAAVWLLLALSVGLCALGALDDWTKLQSGRKGVAARRKFLVQVVLALGIGVYLYFNPIQAFTPGTVSEGSEAIGNGLIVPFLKTTGWSLGLLFPLVVVLVTTGTSNAVNLTDGLDGLAAGCTALVATTFAVLAWLSGDVQSAAAIGLPHVIEGSEVAVVLAAVAGGTLGFLWFNCHPARIFMGDTGSLPLGGCLGLGAILCKQELLLALAGGVLVAEAGSVILQVASFKLRGKRVFLIAPLHHHFQFKGMKETQITIRFWIVTALLCLGSIGTLWLRS